MLFSSLIFLEIFLPVTLAAYYAVKLFPRVSEKSARRYQNTVLLVCSLIFYGFGGIKYLFLMLAVIFLNYAGGFLVRVKDRRAAKRNLTLVIIANLAILFFFKYFNLFMSSVQAAVKALGGAEFDIFRVVLPIGISFYIFQALSYVIDVYRGKSGPRRSFLDFALYISCFPQLIAGPIVQYSDVAEQIGKRRENADQFAEGVRRFIYGLGKKVLIANVMAEVADGIWALELPKIGAGLAWMGAIAYMFQIYYDFSGYSDMAIGLGKMFGFNFKENFNYPYLSRTMQEFWRRWHISLSSWFRDYVYIPLGGSRVEQKKIYRNLLIVFFLTGVWHGANWTFFVWGLYHGLFLILERLFLGKVLEKNPVKLLNRVYTLFAVMVGWILFRANSLGDAVTFIGQLFGKRGVDESVFSFLSLKTAAVFVIAAVGGGLIQKPLKKLAEKNGERRAWVQIPEMLYLLCILLLSMVFLVNNSYNPFIYFQF